MNNDQLHNNGHQLSVGFLLMWSCNKKNAATASYLKSMKKKTATLICKCLSVNMCIENERTSN